MDFLTVVSPRGDSAKRPIDADRLNIGRAGDNDLILADLNVSRVHASLARRADGVWLQDAGGKNGTFVNDRRVDEPVRLCAGDRVRIGSTLIIFNAANTPAVEFDDRPLPRGSGTTFFSPSSLRTPGIPDAPIFIDANTPAPRRAASFADILQEANDELVFHRPLGEILDTIMDLARRAVPFERGLLMLRDGDTLTTQVVRVPPDEAAEVISISRTITDHVLKRQESMLIQDAIAVLPGADSVVAQQLRSVMCVPLWNNREVIGLIYVDNRHRAGLFTDDTLKLLTNLANVAAVKIENARLFEHVLAAERMERELERAREIQDHLLPAGGLAIPGYDVYGHSSPCLSVGGDYFDYVELRDGSYAIVFGDVAGKGLPAALLMASFQAGLDAVCDMGLPAEETIVRLNALVCRRIPDNRFVTFFFGLLDPRRHRLTWVNAGHNAPLLFSGAGEPVRLAPTGPPLGLMPGMSFRAETLEMTPGDLLLGFSDGAVEGRNPADEEFGEARLLETVRSLRDGAPEEIVRQAAAAVDHYCAGTPRQDDITFLVLKRRA